MNRILSLVKPRVLSIVLIVLGLLAVILAVASATIWRPSQTAVATLKPAATTAYVVTGDGVLNMVDSTVTITAKAKDANSTVTLALARSEDAQAWLANDPYTEVTGLSSWEALSGRTITERCNVKAAPTATATSTAKATAKATSTAKATATSTAKATPTPDAKGCIKAVASNASLNGSDMWVTSKTGKGSVSITYDPSSSNYVVLAATDGKQAAPTFSLSWKRTVGTPWLIPGLIVGGLLVAGGVFIFMLDIQMRHQELANAQRRRRRQEEAAARLNKDPNRPLTRLELREKAQAEAAGKVWIDPRRDVPSESAADVDADRTIPAAPNPITDSRGIWAVQAAGGADRVAAAQDQVAPQEGDAVPHLPGTAFNATAFTGAPVMGANPAGAPTPAAATPAAGQSAFSATSAPQAPVSGPSAASAAQASPFAPPSGANTPQARTAPIEESALSAASAAHAAVNPFAVQPGTNPFGPKYSSIFDEPASALSPTPAAGNAALAMERSGASTDVFEPINEPVISVPEASAPSAASSSSANSATPAMGQAQLASAPSADSAPSAASAASGASAESAASADSASAPTPEQADEPQREDVAKEEN